jgi:4-carboxymuconolactone decarboxylase
VAEPSKAPSQQGSSPRYERGLELRRHVLGAEYVDAALAAADDETRPIQEFVTEYAWGTIWAREGLEPRIRSLITLAMLVDLDQPGELRTHVRGALRNGCTSEEIRETLLHSAIYLGVPKALGALQLAREVIAAEGAGSS